MSVHINFHRLAPATINHYTDATPAFITINANDNHHGRVSLYFLADDHPGGELDAAETWLLEALAKVTEAKVAQAKKQQDPLPFAAIGEPIDLTDVQVSA